MFVSTTSSTLTTNQKKRIKEVKRPGNQLNSHWFSVMATLLHKLVRSEPDWLNIAIGFIHDWDVDGYFFNKVPFSKMSVQVAISC